MRFFTSENFRFRFSLCALMCATAFAALAALAAYWTALPSINAHRLVHAIQSDDRATADRLFAASGQSSLRVLGTDYQFRRATIHVRPLTCRQLFRGTRYIRLHLPYGETGEFDWDIGISATHTGLHAGSFST